MSSSGVDYVDIYEDFVYFTTEKNTEDGAPPEFIRIKTEREDSPTLSPLRALTPPSPVHLVPVQLSPKSLSQQEAAPQGTVIQLYSTSRSQAPDNFDAVEQLSCEKSKIMCDTEDPTAPSIVVSTSGGAVTQGKQISAENTINTIHGTGQPFLSTSLLPPPQQQHHHHQGNPFQLHAHGMGMEAHSSQLHQHHQHPPIHSNVHVHQNPFNNHVQHSMMENHVHPQQLNTGQQMNAHQLVHSSPPSHPHHTHVHNHSPSQQMMPFGMHLNPNNVGSGNTFVSHQLNPFHPHHQMSNQQSPHGGNPYQQHPCYMQHPAACMHLQQHQQSMSALNNNRGVSSAVGWMTGPQPVSISSSGTTGNNTFRSGPSTKGPKAHSTPGNHVAVPDPTALPGGLDVLWREVPVECQRFMVPQDIPDTARFRGYFTVCELIALKRALTTRLGCGELPPITPHVTFAPIKSAVKEEGRRGTKRGSKGDGNGHVKVVVKMRNEKENETHNLENINNSNGGLCETTMDADGDSDMQDCEDPSGGELLVSLDNLKDGIHTTTPPAVTGVCVGGAVKEALDTLSSDQQQQQNIGNSSIGNDQIETQVVEVATREAEEEAVVESVKDLTTSSDVPQESTPSSGQKEPYEETRDGGVSTSTEATSLPSMPSLPSLSSIFPGKVSSEVCVTCEPTIDDKDSTNDEDNLHEVAAEICVSASGEVIPSPITTSTVHINTSVPPGTCCVPVENRYAGAPPPYRTATLVVKLLQIGAYQIRSFSSLNPNRLRVLFNTQRMTYECQLPVVRPSPPSGGAHPLRKVLTVDIGFDQVSMMKFGPDKLFMKIEGAPLLTVSYNPAQEDNTFQVLSPHDQYLLDQIDRGQLKLSPCHQLSFLNERLVQQLESQFREHPRFRHLLLSRN